MLIKIFNLSANDKRFADTLEKFAAGVNKVGDDYGDKAQVCNSSEYQDCDVAVFFGSWKPRTDLHHRVKNDIVHNAKHFIVLETPIIGRGPVTNVMQDDWYRIGLNGFLADDGEFNNKNRDASRWKLIQSKRNIELKPYHDGNFIVVTLQVPGDASMRGVSTEQWALESVEEIRKYTDMDIYVRFPQVPKTWREDILNKIKAKKNVVFQVGTKDNLIPTLDKAHCTVCFSSTMSVDSLINGCPTIAMSPANFAYELGSNSLSDIVNPKRPPREQWLNNLGYTTWHVDEIEQGLPWAHLRGKISPLSVLGTN